MFSPGDSIIVIPIYTTERKQRKLVPITLISTCFSIKIELVKAAKKLISKMKIKSNKLMQYIYIIIFNIKITHFLIIYNFA